MFLALLYLKASEHAFMIIRSKTSVTLDKIEPGLKTIKDIYMKIYWQTMNFYDINKTKRPPIVSCYTKIIFK